MKSNNPPHKHHYVPEHYQKGFRNSDGELFAYDKRYKQIKERQPASLLYRPALHTLEHGSDRTTMIEQGLSQLEQGFADFVSDLHNTVTEEATLEELKRDPSFTKVLKLMITLQYWRLPGRSSDALTLAPRLLELYDQSPDEIKNLLNFDRAFVRNIKKTASSASSLKVIQFLLLPILSLYPLNVTPELLFVRPDPGCLFLTSDNPVIVGRSSQLVALEDIIFPISRNLLLVSENIFRQNPDTNFFNGLIYANAFNFVLGSTRASLKFVSQLEDDL